MLTKIKKLLWFDITMRKKLYNEIDSCYERINYLVTKVNKLKDEKRNLEDDNEYYKRAIEDKNRELTLCGTMILERDNQIEELEKTVRQQDREILKLNEQIINLKTEIELFFYGDDLIEDNNLNESDDFSDDSDSN